MNGLLLGNDENLMMKQQGINEYWYIATTEDPSVTWDGGRELY